MKNIILQINVTFQRSLEWMGYLFLKLDSIYNSEIYVHT